MMNHVWTKDIYLFAQYIYIKKNMIFRTFGHTDCFSADSSARVADNAQGPKAIAGSGLIRW